MNDVILVIIALHMKNFRWNLQVIGIFSGCRDTDVILVSAVAALINTLQNVTRVLYQSRNNRVYIYSVLSDLCYQK